MIFYKQGDIFADPADAIVNAVNCVGVMGRGIALQFKKAYPLNFAAYAAACAKNEVCLGKMFVFATNRTKPPRYIVNFPTKKHWKAKSHIEDIESGLKDLVNVVVTHQIRSIAIPPLGSGLGGLHWVDVKPRIESAVQQLRDVRVLIYEPKEVAASDDNTLFA